MSEIASTGLFEQNALTLQNHLDADKHWIGEALPVPSNNLAANSGLLSDVGVSPFPARADHTHDNRTIWGAYSSSGNNAPGSGARTGISGMTNIAGRDMLSGGSTISIPSNGIWQVSLNWQAVRVGGGNLTGYVNVVFIYTSPAYTRSLYRATVAALPTSVFGFVQDFAYVNSAPQTVSFAIDNGDSAAWTISASLVDVRRLCAYSSA